MSRAQGAYERMLNANPERVNRAGYWADLDGFEVHVIHLGGDLYGWKLYRGRDEDTGRSCRFISGNSCSSVVAAWRAGCTMLATKSECVFE